jgi:hypothetical protein
MRGAASLIHAPSCMVTRALVRPACIARMTDQVRPDQPPVGKAPMADWMSAAEVSAVTTT